MTHDHAHPRGKQPTDATLRRRQEVAAQLPFDDDRDLAEARRGFLAAPEYRQILAEAGHVAWNIGDYDFLLGDEDFASIHPSLQRQARLNMEYGLFEVVPGHIYQVRGFDLANISFIRSDTGWIVFDPLTAKETAAAALALVNEHLGERPVVAVVYSHSHGDHFGGAHGVVDVADVHSGAVPVIAPVGFLEHAVSENVYAGNAMVRRMFYQYGTLLERGPFGHVDQAIGKGVAAGTVGLIAPTVDIVDDIQELTIDGVRMVFQNTPGTEAPAEMNTWFPDLKAFWAAENIVATIHNIYTLRGALVRDALEWSRQINRALHLFGQEAEVMFASHSWPRWGNERIQEVMRTQRDTYAHLNNGVMHLANQGVTINEIHRVYQVPDSLQRSWAARSYHGSVAHNARAVVNRYLGYWDGNPSTLIPLAPRESAPLYVELMGGAERILARAHELIAAGDDLLAVEILNKLVYAEPANEAARDLLAEAFEQIGYQQESPSVRNSFLAAAFELRSGIPEGQTANATSPDLVRALSTQQFLDYLAIRLDSTAAGEARGILNLRVTDIGEEFVVEVSNGTLTSVEGFQSASPDATLTVTRAALEDLMVGATTAPELLAAGRATLEGDPSAFLALGGALVEFAPGFPIMPGTTPSGPAVPADGFGYHA
ncbi:Metallo-beta-lactamase superfamily protein [Microbacterium ginsengisoli]|uniref:Metallo-beta-lactamase superfamily protein n=1 Tax=Microbacterium ginsengisoli TaxID=400772 RepID=A0A0F0LZ69_9MICO|nr:alkyl sulfatase dimerization domain-containing protein [Microbacterium ginsengisoli]KJL38258.1 Metallo-beta-lactamase superfamily protein [Microbacterium ginsengisoli]MBN9209622.1 MBL fold metallo-hydrolase [Microbacterium ginsengisoli]